MSAGWTRRHLEAWEPLSIEHTRNRPSTARATAPTARSSDPAGDPLQMATEPTKIARVRYSFSSVPSVRPNGRDRRCKPPPPLRWANQADQGAGTGAGPFVHATTHRAGAGDRRAHSTPVVPVMRDGDVWVVSPYGEVGCVTSGARSSDCGGAGAPCARSWTPPATPVLRAYLDVHALGRAPPLRCHEGVRPTTRCGRTSSTVFALTPVS